MYIPKSNAEHDKERIYRLIENYPFATLMSTFGGETFITHVPFLLVRSSQPFLQAHLARANPHSRIFENQPQAVVIFQGPHAYISPTWYVENDVPTWNYTAVHVHGEIRVISGNSNLRQLVDSLAAKFESQMPDPWQPQYPERELAGIVGIEIQISKIEGKFKLSQNRSQQDQQGVIKALTAAGGDNAVGVAALMRENQTKSE